MTIPFMYVCKVRSGTVDYVKSCLSQHNENEKSVALRLVAWVRWHFFVETNTKFSKNTDDLADTNMNRQSRDYKGLARADKFSDEDG